MKYWTLISPSLRNIFNYDTKRWIPVACIYWHSNHYQQYATNISVCKMVCGKILLGMAMSMLYNECLLTLPFPDFLPWSRNIQSLLPGIYPRFGKFQMVYFMLFKSCNFLTCTVVALVISVDFGTSFLFYSLLDFPQFHLLMAMSYNLKPQKILPYFLLSDHDLKVWNVTCDCQVIMSNHETS